MNPNKFPFLFRIRHNGSTFLPTMIDFDNRTAYRQIGQASGNGEWWDFNDCDISINPQYLNNFGQVDIESTNDIDHELEYLYTEIGRMGRDHAHAINHILLLEQEKVARKIHSIAGHRPVLLINK